MRSKRKKTPPVTSRRIYTTREIMEITEQRRLKEDAAGKVVDTPKIDVVENKPISPPEDLSQPAVTPASDIIRVADKVQEPQASRVKVPVNDIIGALVLVFSLIIFFLIVSSQYAESWVRVVALKLNALIVDGSFVVLRCVQGACDADGLVLRTHYYKISLQGDWVALYSLELLIAFAALFIYFQKTSLKKKRVVLVSLIPLAMIANILRVVIAFGLALNDGAAHADQYFYGISEGVVFVFIIAGLLLLEFLSSP